MATGLGLWRDGFEHVPDEMAFASAQVLGVGTGRPPGGSSRNWKTSSRLRVRPFLGQNNNDLTKNKNHFLYVLNELISVFQNARKSKWRSSRSERPLFVHRRLQVFAGRCARHHGLNRHTDQHLGHVDRRPTTESLPRIAYSNAYVRQSTGSETTFFFFLKTSYLYPGRPAVANLKSFT